MNEKQFQYVVVLSEEGSFSKAADKLGIAQPTLSQYIKKIESQIGAELFERSTTDVLPTAAGQLFIASARRILQQEKQLREQLADLADNAIGHVVVGIAPTRCQYLMPVIIRRFKQAFPGMHIVIEERFMQELLADAERGVFDLCVATLPVDEQIFEIAPIMREEVVLAVPLQSPFYGKLQSAARQSPARIYPVIDISLIDEAPYVFLADTQPTQKQLTKLCATNNFSVTPAVRCMSIETQFTMVKEGFGLALIPSSLAKYCHADSVGYFSLEQELPSREMVVIHRKGQYLSKAVQALKQIITAI